MNAKENWVVEVQCSAPVEGGGCEWVQIAECGDSATAIAIGDALHNLMQTGIVGRCPFQIRTRISVGDR